MSVRDRTKKNGLKLQPRKFRLDIRRSFLTVSVVKHWSRVPSKAVESLFLKVFKSSLDR